jgi:phospholipase/lecithinase/hemolysin
MIRLAAAILLLVSTLTAQSPHPYTQLYVFGDSYSDTGAGFLYSDGPTAVAYLAQRLAIPFTYYGDPASKGKGLNFSVSGGKTGSDPGVLETTGAFRVGMKNQVEQFAALVKSGEVKFNPATTMFFLAGGLNDRGSPDGYTRTNLEEEIDTLYALGGRRFMVALLPTQIPAFATAGILLNPELSRIPAEERAKHPDIRIANSDWGPYFDEVITHLNKYNLTDATLTCGNRTVKAQNPAACATPTHFFYYAAHPSTAAHKAVGDMLYNEALTNPPDEPR